MLARAFRYIPMYNGRSNAVTATTAAATVPTADHAVHSSAVAVKPRIVTASFAAMVTPSYPPGLAAHIR